MCLEGNIQVGLCGRQVKVKENILKCNTTEFTTKSGFIDPNSRSLKNESARLPIISPIAPLNKPVDELYSPVSVSAINRHTFARLMFLV